MTRLEPCPLCGSHTAPTLFPSFAPGDLPQVTCDMAAQGCGLTLRRNKSGQAVDDWNRREERERYLRDRFAGQAIVEAMKFTANTDGTYNADDAAEWAYDIADAMLAERMKGREPGA